MSDLVQSARDAFASGVRCAVLPGDGLDLAARAKLAATLASDADGRFLVAVAKPKDLEVALEAVRSIYPDAKDRSEDAARVVTTSAAALSTATLRPFVAVLDEDAKGRWRARLAAPDAPRAVAFAPAKTLRFLEPKDLAPFVVAGLTDDEGPRPVVLTPDPSILPPGFAPRGWQVTAAKAVVEHFRRGMTRLLVSVPTGAGKTKFALAFARMCGLRVLWIAHTNELVNQSARAAAEFWGPENVGIIQGSRYESARRIVVASVATLASRARDRLSVIAKAQADPAARFDLVIVDEAHHAAAGTWATVLDRLGISGTSPSHHAPLLLGLTATPMRTDKLRLSEVFDAVAFRLSLFEAIRDGILVPFTTKVVRLPELDELEALAAAVDDDDDLPEAEVVKVMEHPTVVAAVADAAVELCASRKTILFGCSIRQCEMIAERISSTSQVRARAIFGAHTDRDEILRQFAIGDIDILANPVLLTEGFDDPSVSAVFVARPTKSKGRWIQCVGRGLRKSPGKTDCLVVDLAGNRDLGLVVGASLLEDEEDKDEKADQEPDAGDDDDDVGEATGADRLPDLLKAQRNLVEDRGRSFRWLELGGDRVGAFLGPWGAVVLERDTSPEADADAWTASALDRRALEASAGAPTVSRILTAPTRRRVVEQLVVEWVREHHGTEAVRTGAGLDVMMVATLAHYAKHAARFGVAVDARSREDVLRGYLTACLSDAIKAGRYKSNVSKAPISFLEAFFGG